MLVEHFAYAYKMAAAHKSLRALASLCEVFDGTSYASRNDFSIFRIAQPQFFVPVNDNARFQKDGWRRNSVKNFQIVESIDSQMLFDQRPSFSVNIFRMM